MIAELEKTYRLAESEPGAWSLIEIVIHEWHESAKAISSPELAAAFSDEIVEIEQAKNDRINQIALRDSEEKEKDRDDRLESTVQAIGVGLAAGGIAASKIGQKVDRA